MGLSADQATVPHGTVSFLVTNAGSINHEMVVLPLASSQTVGARPIGGDDKIDEAASPGEASKTDGAGAGHGAAPGASSWMTIALAPGRYGMGSMGAGDYGMMTNAQMGALGNAPGVAFDRLWLPTMIKHHLGAVAMSRIEPAQGTNPDTEKLAQAVIDAQSAEITQMNSMLADMGR